MNQELFAKINAVIKPNPEKLHMATWESSWDDLIEADPDGEYPTCGTTRCVAGHAIFETIGVPLFDEDTGSYTPQFLELSGELAARGSIKLTAAELLEIDYETADILFHASEEEALLFVDRAANGDFTGALDVFGL